MKLTRTKHKSSLKHEVLKWFWTGFGIVGLIDFVIRRQDSLANSVPVLFALSVLALAIGEWAAEEAAGGNDDDS